MRHRWDRRAAVIWSARSRFRRALMPEKLQLTKGRRPPTKEFCYSARVRKSVLFIVLPPLFVATLAISKRQAPPGPAQSNPRPLIQQATPPTSPAPSLGSTQQTRPLQAPPLQPAYTGPAIVLDPAHGGTDTGARGQNGVVEKDVVLQYARAVRVELVRQGYKVVLTRDDDSNPSYDDRAAMANSYHDAIFVSLHISSTGTPGTARAYYYQFWAPLPPSASAASANGDQSVAPVALTAPPNTVLPPWNEAQRRYADTSRRLADQLQGQLARLFSGSPVVSTTGTIRGLRSVAAPAVAIEVSSVSVADAKSLALFEGPLATAIVKGMQAFRGANSAGAQ